MPTTETKIWQALKSGVNNIALPYAKDWQGAEFTQGAETYLEVRHFPNSSDRIVIENDGQHKYKGILQVSLMYPVAKKHSYEVMQEKAGVIAATFTAGQVLIFDNAKVLVEKKPDIATPFRDEGFWKFPVSIRYYSFN